MSAIDGVFLAVKCESCGAIHPAESDDFLAFYGSVTAGLEQVLVGVDPPRKPAKKAVSVVCRAPECLVGLVQRMLTDGERGDDDTLWQQVLRIWARDAGLEVVDAAPVESLQKTRARAARSR